MKTFNHTLFTYKDSTKTFVTEASDLQLPVGRMPDKFCLMGKKDGVGFWYVNADIIEGEVVAWNFKGVHDGVVYKAVIFND